MRTGDADDRHRRPARADRLGDHPPRILPDQPRRLRRRDLRRSRSAEISPEISPEIGRSLTVSRCPHAPDLAVGRPFSPRFRLHSKWTSLCGFILAFMARGRPSVAVVAPAAAVVVMRTVPFHVAGDGHRARRDAVRVRSCARRARRAPRVAGAVLLLSLRRCCCRRARSRTDFSPGWQRRALLALRHYGPQRSPRRSTAHSDSRISMLTMHSGASLLLLCRPLERSFTRGMQSQCWRARHHHASSW